MTKKTPPRCHRGDDVFAAWRDEVLRGQPPIRYRIGTGPLGDIEIGPGLVPLLGGAPGSGKTAFSNQAVFDALRLNPDLRACICNVEMSVSTLLDRQLARLSGVDLAIIHKRLIGPQQATRIDAALRTLEPLMDRLFFVRPPFDLDNVAAVADESKADLLLLDYVQRIKAPGKHGDRRSAVDAMMDYLRKFADAGMAVLAVAAVARTKDARGRSSYSGEGLTLASFRESSELEFGADDAFMLVPEPASDVVTLRHLKARHSEPRDIQLVFHRACQRFSPVDSAPKPGSRISSGLANLWNSTSPAKDGTNGSRN